MDIITDKKEIIKVIGDWTTTHIDSKYELGSNKIELQYKGQRVLYKNEDIKNVAYIALQCHAINNKQYASLGN